MDDAKQQLADKLKNANNILVTVSRNPSVDQLAACLGLTLLLNKLNKHAAAVFSGEVPSTIEFLQPEETLEKNTDSLRDFIIALDKSKADKLRYKVEDNIVRIFITPYRTSITQDDLDFSQGDFNVDVVVALGVHEQTDLDDAIIAHGRILHDATVGSINITPEAGIGSINWNDPTASSLSELVTELAQAINKDLIDGQIATALLTGIVAETDRFSNQKTTSQTMSISAALMAAGANQQLVATKLSGDMAPPPDKPITDQPADLDKPAEPGTLEISHGGELPPPSDEPLADIPEAEPEELPETRSEDAEPEAPPEINRPTSDHLSSGSKLITEPPTLGGTLSANVRPEPLDPVTDPLSLPTENKGQLLSRSDPVATMLPSPPAPETPAEPIAPAEPEDPAIEDKSTQTLTELEKSVAGDHANDKALDAAREEVTKALDATPATPEPATPETPAEPQAPSLAFNPAQFGITSDAPAPEAPATDAQVVDPNAPPPVPPPIPFQFGNPNPPTQ